MAGNRNYTHKIGGLGKLIEVAGEMCYESGKRSFLIT